MCESTELARNFLSDVELGRKSPSLRTIAALARALGVRPHQLVKDAEESEDTGKPSTTAPDSTS